jgi:hypothetical protein
MERRHGWHLGRRQERDVGMTTIAGLLIKVGDDYSKVLTVTDSAGAAVNLTGATLTLHLRAPGATTDALTATLTLTMSWPAYLALSCGRGDPQPWREQVMISGDESLSARVLDHFRVMI